MNTKAIDAIANAVLYEGYMLYPYRPSSVKNRQRFNFGVLYPRSYSDAQTGSDAWSMQTECLVEGDSRSSIEISVRFLKMVNRSVWKRIYAPRSTTEPEFESVATLEVGAKTYVPWQEATECEVSVPVSGLDSLTLDSRTTTPVRWSFEFPAKEKSEYLYSGATEAKSSATTSTEVVGVIKRTEAAISGAVELSAERAAQDVFKVAVRVRNLTQFEMQSENAARHSQRADVLMQSMVSTHIVLHAADGQFVSLLEPVDRFKDLAASCRNVGSWPVLVGAEGDRSLLLASPIILYDYPQIAPESPGDLFDGLEIDEILALRIMTMTDAEKSEMRDSDERARKILERTETLPMEHLVKLHGSLRELHPLKEEMP